MINIPGAKKIKSTPSEQPGRPNCCQSLISSTAKFQLSFPPSYFLPLQWISSLALVIRGERYRAFKSSFRCVCFLGKMYRLGFKKYMYVYSCSHKKYIIMINIFRVLCVCEFLTCHTRLSLSQFYSLVRPESFQ